jgi:hypothetical protein
MDIARIAEKCGGYPEEVLVRTVQGLDRIIGTVKGPGETPHEYTFIAPDPERRVKHGEFVYYLGAVDGEERQILGRVTQRRSVKLFPDSFMADPSVPPAPGGRAAGLRERRQRTLRDDRGSARLSRSRAGRVYQPARPAGGRRPVYIAGDELLTQVLSKTAQTRRTGQRPHLGSLLSRPDDAVPVALSVRGFTSTHLAIIASTGSGKSYLAGVLLEELMMPHNRAAVLVVDPHGEYSTLQEMPNLPEFREGNYKPRVRIFRPDQLRVRIDTLTHRRFALSAAQPLGEDALPVGARL